jgi:hypothetical protein
MTEHIRNIWFSCFLLQISNYSKDKLLMRQNVDRPAGRDMSDLFGKFLPACGENQNQNYALWELFAT